MFPTRATTASLSEPARAGDRHIMPARSSSAGGIPSRAIGLPGIMFTTLGVSPAGHLGPNHHQPSPKVTNIPPDQISTCFYGTSGLSSLNNLYLSHLLTPTTRTLPHRRQQCSTPLIIKILLMFLTGPDNPLLCHYFCYYLKWIFR